MLCIYIQACTYNNIADISPKLEKMANRFIFNLGSQQYDISRAPWTTSRWVFSNHPITGAIFLLIRF